MDLKKIAFYPILVVFGLLCNYSSSAQCIVTMINASSDTIRYCHNTIADVDTFTNTANLDSNYFYIIASPGNLVIDTTSATNTYDFENLNVGEYHVYGFNYFGNLFVQLGNNINTVFASTCFQLSNNYIVIYNDGSPIPVNAGTDQVVCNNTQSTLIATPPTTGIGNWSPINTTATIQNPNQSTTTVTGLTTGVNTFEWTVENGACSGIFALKDTISITVDSVPSANAGADITLCGQTSFVFDGNDYGNATGMWNQIAGAFVNIPNPLDSNALVPTISAGIYQFEWMISNGACVSRDTVTVTVAEPTIADVGPDVQTCFVPSLSLNGNTPSSGAGLWTQISGPLATIANPIDPLSTVSGLGVGSYDFVWTVNNGVCSAADTVNWLLNPLPQGSVSNVKPVSVAGAMDGEIEVCVTAGIPPFTISMIPATGIINSATIAGCSNGYLITNLPGGTYDIYIADVNNCRDTIQDVMVYEPDCNLFNISIALVSNISCFGANDGQITIATQGGLLPITYEIGNGVPPVTLATHNHTFTNLMPGNYPVIKVTDAAGCVSTYPFNINVAEPGQIQLAAIPTDVSGAGNTDGMINLCVIGGVWPYSVSLSPNVGSPVNQGQQSCNLNYQFINLPAGVYSITVTDNSGCVKVLSNIIVSSPACTMQIDSIVVTNVSCSGGNDGAIAVYASGANFYKYSLDGGSNFTNLTPNNFYFAGQLNATNYSVVVRDNAFCQTTYVNNPVLIADPAPITFASTITDATGIGNDGSILLCVNGGVPGYSLSYTSTNNGAGTLTSIAGPCIGNYVLTSLSPDIFDFFIEDANGCTDTLLNQIVNGVNCSSFNINQALGNDVKCNGDSTGFINIILAGGTPPYQYQINGTTVATGTTTNQTLGGLPVGSYTITVIDALSCSKSQIIIINEPFLLTTTQIPVNPSSVGTNDGEICITPAGGVSPYLVSASCGPVLVGSGNSCSGAYHIANLPAGSCNITSIDQNNCMVIDTILLSSPTCSGFSLIAVNATNITCNGADDGSVTVVTNGGVAPYTYSIDGGVTYQSNVTNSYTYNNLSPGSYTIIVRDGVGCQIVNPSNPIILTEPGILSASVVGVNPSAAGNDGEICISPAGGTAPYTVTASCGTVQAGNGTSCSGTFSILNLTAGTCYLTILDDNNCTFLDSVTLFTANCAVVSASIVGINPGTAGNDGEICISPAGGTPPYTVTASCGTVQTGNGANCNGTFSVQNLSAGTCFLTILDDNNCTFLDTVTLYTANCSTFNLTAVIVDNISCNGLEDGSITINVSGGTPPYFYSIDNGFTFANSSNNSFVFPDREEATYNIVVQDISGCSRTYQSNPVMIVEPDLVSIGGNTLGSCTENNTGRIDITPLGGTLPYTYLWSNGSLTEDQTGLAAGAYEVTVCDINQCCEIASYTLQLLQSVVVDAGADLTIFSDETATVGIQTNVLPPFDVVWTPTNGVSDPIGETVDLTPQQTTTYTIQVTSREGCIGSDELVVNVTPRGVFAIPSGFTPNGDGKNETFSPIVLGANQLQYFRIFNRWGELIHSESTPWDGSYNGEAQPIGTYIYVIEYRDDTGETFVEKGHFSLIR